jgi:hypothetical protein
MAAKAPEPGLPLERILLVAALGVGAIILVWGAGRLLKPKPARVVAPAPPPPPPPPPPAESETTPPPSFPPISAPKAPAPAAVPIVTPEGSTPPTPTQRADGTWVLPPPQ